MAYMTRKTLPLPMCDKCRKPVDRLISETDLGEAKACFAVFCHGEKEIMSLDMDYDITGLGQGIAFRQDLITNPINK